MKKEYKFVLRDPFETVEVVATCLEEALEICTKQMALEIEDSETVWHTLSEWSWDVSIWCLNERGDEWGWKMLHVTEE